MTPELEKSIHEFCSKHARVAQGNVRSMHELVAVVVAHSLIDFYKLVETNLNGKETRQETEMLNGIGGTVVRKAGRPRKDEVRQIEL